MARDWYIRISDVEATDPSDTLRKLVVEGRVTRETFIKKGVSGTSSAGNIALFPLTKSAHAHTSTHLQMICSNTARAENIAHIEGCESPFAKDGRRPRQALILFRFLQVVTVLVVGAAYRGPDNGGQRGPWTGETNQW